MHLHLIISNSQEKLEKIGPPFDSLLKTNSDELNESIIILPRDSRRKIKLKNVDFSYLLVVNTTQNHLIFVKEYSTYHSKTAR